jgi:hypothetical protein
MEAGVAGGIASHAGRSLASVALLGVLLCPSSAFSSQAGGIEQAKANATEHAGDAACLGCHKQQALPYLHTSHHLTSQLVTPASMKFSRPAGARTLMIVDPAKRSDEPYLFFQIKASDDRYYQSAVTGWGSKRQTRTEPMDIVIGSGRRGQTFLYWDADRLFELPISYWTDGHEWINSPGYGDGTADFGRPVNPGCLECHATGSARLPFADSNFRLAVEDYRTAKMPAVNQGLLDGQLAWRQHDGGHTDAPNMKYFIEWADKFMGHTPPS